MKKYYSFIGGFPGWYEQIKHKHYKPKIKTIKGELILSNDPGEIEMKKIDITKKIAFDLQHLNWNTKGLYVNIYYHESHFKIHDVGIVYFNGEHRLEKGYILKLSDDENVHFFKLV